MRGALPSRPMAVVSPTPVKSVFPFRSSLCSRSSSSSSSSSISSPCLSSCSIGSSNSHHKGSRLRITSRGIAKSRNCVFRNDDSVPWKHQCEILSSNGSNRCNGGGRGFGFVLGERVEEKRRHERGGVLVCSAGAGGIGRDKEGFRIPERAKVVALVALVMCLCNADRVVMSVAVVPLAAKYGWSSSFLGIVQSSFLWGYLLSSVAGGALADRYGGKRVMAWGVAFWSLATFLTPWAADHSTAMLLVVRALFGLAEGVALPSMNTLLSRWFPCHERASAVGLSMAGFHLGNVISFLATPIIMSSIGLSGAFALFASLGFMWLSLWATGVTNDPRDSPQISISELQLIRAGKNDDPASSSSKFPPLRHLLSKLPTWAIIFANVTNNWGYFVLLSWMPVYFNTVYNVNLKQAAWFSAIPWGMMALSGYIAGAISDSLIASGHSITRVRKIMQSIGFIGPALALLCLKYAQTPNVAAALMTVALSFSSFGQAGFLLNMQDIAPRYAGFLHGIANSVGTLAAIISTIGTGYFVEWLGSFQAFLTLTAALYIIATIFWNLYATGEQVFY